MSTLVKSTVPMEFQAQIDRLTRRIDYLASQIKSNKEVPKKEWYRPADVCKILGISRSKFESLKRAGVFSAQKVGGVVYIAASDLAHYLPKTSR